MLPKEVFNLRDRLTDGDGTPPKMIGYFLHGRPTLMKINTFGESQGHGSRAGHGIIGSNATLLRANPGGTGEEDRDCGDLIALAELTF